MRVFITGIEGFVGRHLARSLAGSDVEVHGSTLAQGSESPIECQRLVTLDVRDAEGVKDAISSSRPDAVVHLAGAASVAESFTRPVPTFTVNALGSLSVLEACRQCEVARVLLVTSCEVYGDPDPAGGRILETAPLAPISPYGASKASQDLLGYQYGRSYGVPVVRVRPFPHTGPGQRAQYLFPSVARRIALAETGEGPATIAVGNVSTVRDLLDVRDVVRAYIALLETGVPGEVYNVCRGEAHPLSDALATLCDLANVAVRIEPEEAQARPADCGWMVGDPRKLMDQTGWSAEIEWETTMRDLLDDMRCRVAAEAAVGADG